jgi:ankyrin repeat protein
MGQGLSCAASQGHRFFSAVHFGDLDTVNAMLERDPSLLYQTTYDRQYPLHIAAANGQIEVPFLAFLLKR